VFRFVARPNADPEARQPRHPHFTLERQGNSCVDGPAELILICCAFDPASLTPGDREQGIRMTESVRSERSLEDYGSRKTHVDKMLHPRRPAHEKGAKGAFAPCMVRFGRTQAIEPMLRSEGGRRRIWRLGGQLAGPAGGSVACIDRSTSAA